MIDYIELNFEERFLRRKTLRTASGHSLRIDLPHAKRFQNGEIIEALHGPVQIRAASEPLYAVEGDLTRLAWHIGNRHTPCQIEKTRLLIAQDEILKKMLEGLGAKVTLVMERFEPESGAYSAGHHHATA